MPNFARILINILLYILYVVIIAFLGGFIFPLLYISFGKEIPVYTSEVYNLVFFIIAGFVFLLTFIFRKSCYLRLKNNEETDTLLKTSYTQKKNQQTHISPEKSTELKNKKSYKKEDKN